MRNILLSCLLLLLCGCAASQDASYLDYGDKPSQVQACYRIADSLLAQMLDKHVSDLRIMKTVFSDIDYPNNVYSHGRMYAEEVSSRLVQRGLSVVEINPKYYTLTSVSNGSASTLTPTQVGSAKDVGASAVLVGYYKQLREKGPRILYVRIVRVQDSSVIASDDFEIDD